MSLLEFLYKDSLASNTDWLPTLNRVTHVLEWQYPVYSNRRGRHNYGFRRRAGGIELNSTGCNQVAWRCYQGITFYLSPRLRLARLSNADLSSAETALGFIARLRMDSKKVRSNVLGTRPPSTG